jgi:hypothetical protein
VPNGSENVQAAVDLKVFFCLFATLSRRLVSSFSSQPPYTKERYERDMEIARNRLAANTQRMESQVSFFHRFLFVLPSLPRAATYISLPIYSEWIEITQ